MWKEAPSSIAQLMKWCVRCDRDRGFRKKSAFISSGPESPHLFNFRFLLLFFRRYQSHRNKDRRLMIVEKGRKYYSRRRRGEQKTFKYLYVLPKRSCTYLVFLEAIWWHLNTPAYSDEGFFNDIKWRKRKTNQTELFFLPK